MWGIFRIFALSIRNLGTMKITLIIKKSVKRYDTESKATIYARLRDGRQVDMVAPTRLTINPNLWDDKAEQVKSKTSPDQLTKRRFQYPELHLNILNSIKPK